MTSVLVVKDGIDLEFVKKFLGTLEFDYVVINNSKAVCKIEGLRITQVYFTPDVLVSSMNGDLFDRLHNTLIAMSVKISDGFRLIG